MSCKGQAEPFDILNRSLKIDLRGLTLFSPEQTAFFFFCPDNTDDNI